MGEAETCLWRPPIARVVVSKRAGPLILTLFISTVSPSPTMSCPVMMATKRRQVAGAGRAVLRIGNSMVQVTLGGRHPAAGSGTSRILGLDNPSHHRRWSPGRRPDVDDISFVILHHVPPL